MRATIHLPEKLLRLDPPGGQGFYAKLDTALTQDGYTVRFARRRPVVEGQPYPRDGFHFVHQGLVRQPNALNTGVAYIYPFWYADREGVFGQSSIAAKRFDPERIDAEAASRFVARLRSRLVARRVSKHAQPDARIAVPEDCIAVFLQGPSIPVARAQYMNEREMVDAVLAGASGSPVVIKPHPRTADPEMAAYLRQLSEMHHGLQVVDANVHDILAAARVTCSISSSVSLEGFLHDTPAILFGQTDFAHIADTVTRRSEFLPALRRSDARRADPPFAAFLFWFLQQNCINMGRADWFDRIRQRMARTS